MLKKRFLLAAFIGLTLYCHSQTITRYTYSAFSGTFAPLTGATSPGLTAGNSDEGYFNSIPIGFDFWYMGTRYTSLSASTNGWLTLGNTISSSTPINSLSSGGVRPILAMLWDDLEISPTTLISYLTSGITGTRVTTIEFLNVQWQGTATGNTISFQAKLYEGTGRVEFQYRQESGTMATPSASIGLSATGTGSGNYLAVNNTGTSASSTVEASVNAKPTSGNTYAFTPPIPAAPVSLIFSSVSNNSMTLSWSDLSSNETGFVLYQSTDGINYTFASQVAANTTTSVQSGLIATTTYYWKVHAVSEGGLSAGLTGTQASACTAPSPPTVSSPVTYCQGDNSAALSATGSDLSWGGFAGSVGGASALTSTIYVDAAANRKTNFSTLASNVILGSVEYYIPAFQTLTGLRLSIYNSSGTIIATSSTITSVSAGASIVKISNTFNYTLTAAGDYSIGVSAGSGNIGYDNPTLPLIESSNTIRVTGVTSAGYRCFNNFQFTTASSTTSPIPSTTTVGSTDYYVSQTLGGCKSALATITVTINAPNLSLVPTTSLASNYKFNGNAADDLGNNNGTLLNAPSLTTNRFNEANSAYNFNGSSQYMSTAQSYLNPINFTISIWFKTSSVTGGRLMGFGISQTGLSGRYDRQIYMNNAGQVYFGVYPGGVQTLNTTASYNDGTWHQATATLSSTAGMALYMDGVLVSSNPAVTSAENYTGYWRLGYDNNNGWPTQPSNYYFTGVLDDALIYQRAISAGEVSTIYTSPEGAGNNGPACVGSLITLSATFISGATYAWTGPNSFSSSLQNPTLTYTTTDAGLYSLQVTSGGCTSSAYTILASSTAAGQWLGAVSTDWATAANWCTGVVPSATTNVIISASAPQMPIVSTSASCRNLTINAGATLTTTLAGTLNIAGTLLNNGTMVNSGTTNFNGTSGQQTFSGVSSFYNLTLTNTTSLLLPAATVVTNNLTLSSGTLIANNFGLTVGGNWINNNSTTAFTRGTGTVTFNGTGPQSIGGTFVTSYNNLTIANIGNTVTLARNASIFGNLSVTSGTFNLEGFSANRNAAGGTLTLSNNTFLKIGGTSTYPSNYGTSLLSVASTVDYAGTNQTVASQIYGNLTLSSSSGAAVKTLPATALTVVGNLSSNLGTGTSVTFAAASSMTISGNVLIGVSTTFNGGSFVHSVGGNWVVNGTFSGSTGTVTLVGTGTVVDGTGANTFNNLTIAASQISFTANTISMTGNLATQSPGSFSQVSSGTLVMTGLGKTITGSGISLNNLTVSGSVSTTTSFELTGNLLVSNSFTGNFGTITLSGTSKTISGTGSKSFSNLSVTGTITTAVDFSISSNLSVTGSLIASAGVATFTGTSSLSGAPNLYNVTINGTSLQLSADATLGISNSFLISSGTLDVVTSSPNTVNFNGAGAQSINAIAYNNLIMSNGNTKTASGNLIIGNSITIGTGTTFIPGSFTHSVQSDWNNNGTFNAGSSTILFVGTATSHVRGATTFNILTLNQTSMTTQVLLENDVTADIVNMTNGIMVTGSNMLTITNTRTGNGRILGTIRRNHSFTTGVAYAFKHPNNSITFASVASVSSVTVIAKEASVVDFPFGSSVNEEYDITIPIGTYLATLRLDYQDVGLNGNDESTMGLWNYNGSTWTAVGKTANSTTSNYVELGGLTSISNRWTLSDQSNQVRWNGSVSSDWHTAANWTAVVGVPSMPPSAADIADFGTVTFGNQPTISASALSKNIHFGSAKAVTLTLASGGSLTTSNVEGDWSVAARHTIQVNNQTLTINGDLDLSDGVGGHDIHLNIGSGTVDISGSLDQSGNADISFSGPGTMHIFSDFESSGGTFSGGSGTVLFDGNENQHVAHVNYNHLTINKTGGLAIIDADASIGGNLLVAAGQLDNSSTTTILGDVTIASGGTFKNTNIVHVGGNWLNNGNFIADGINTIFDGNGTQTISSTTFNNFTINKPVGTSAVLTGDIVLNGDLTVTSGTLNIGTFLSNRSVLGGTLTLDAAATFIVSANNSPLNFATGSLATTSTVIADGIVPQFIFGLEFGNLIFRNGGLKTLVSPILVKGNLEIESGATFDGASETLTLEDDWLNSGTFVPSSGTVICNGTTKVISGNTTFNRMTVNGSYTILNDVTYNGLLNITASGSLSGGASIHTTLNGDLINSGILYTLGTTTFTGNVQQTLSLINAVQTVAITVNFNGSVSPVLNSTSAPQYGFLNINNTGGVYPSVGWTIAYALNVGAGASFIGGTATHNLLGSLTNNGTITSNGTFNFIPSTAKTLDFGTDFTSTGTVVFGSTGAITLAGTPIGFRNVVISNTNATGISPSSNWILANNFTINSSATFHAGSHTYSIGGRINNLGTFNCSTSHFILNGATSQEIHNSSPFNNLTINNSGSSGLLTTDVTVNGVLNFLSGMLQTDGYALVQPSSGTVTGAAQNTGWVFGNFRKQVGTGATVKAFEIGDGSYFTPVSIVFSSVTTAGYLTASTTTGDHPLIGNSSINTAKSVNRYWTLLNAGIGFTNYAATFHFVAADVDGGAVTSAFKVARYDGLSWTLPNIASANMTNIQATTVTSMGDFVIGENCNAGTMISYDNTPYCSNAETALVTLLGNTGGTFSSNPTLSVNVSTGAVNLASSTAGSYTVTYTVDAITGCASFFTTGDIIITPAPQASISYTGDSLCSSVEVAAITLIGTVGGTYSSTAGILLEANTGTVDLLNSTAGTYTVTYSVDAAGGCSSYFSSTDLTITTQPFATGTYEGNPYCSNDGIAFPTGTAVGLAGTLISTPGLIIDPPTGVIDLALSTAGTYTVTYQVPARGGCTAYSNTTTVAITAAPFATVSYTGSPYMLNQGTASVTLTGSAGGDFSSTAGLTLDPTSGDVTLVSSLPATYTVTYTVPAANGCDLFATTADITITYNLKTWDGGAVTNVWGDGVNWNPDGIPTASDNVNLNGPYTINVNVVATTHDLTLNDAGLTLTINSGNSVAVNGNLTLTAGTFNTGSSGSQNLTLGGNWVNNGAIFVANTNTVGFIGASTQTISGSSPSTFHHIAVSNTANPSVSVESSQNMAGVLTLVSNAIFDADGSTNTSVFTLLSASDNPTQDAAIGILPAGAQILGNVTVQRFMTKVGGTNFRIYRYLSSPVRDAPVSDLQSEIPVTGPFGGSSNCPGCLPNASMFYYDESILNDVNGNGTVDYNDGYVRYPAANNAETMEEGRGYAVFVRGNILPSTLWDLRGVVNTANVTDISHPINFTSSGNILNDGWNLVGNPFPSTIDWNASSGWTKTNLSGTIYVTDNTNGPTQHTSWNGVVGTNGGSRYVAMGQGFWVKANAAAPILQSNEQVKAPGIQTVFFREEALSDMLRITLFKDMVRDEAVIHFRTDGTPGHDTGADALKLKNQTFNLSSLSDANALMSINSWSELTCSTSIKLSVTEIAPGPYTLRFSNLSSFGGQMELVLKDLYLNTSLTVTEDAIYPFTVTTDSGSFGRKRFVLQFEKPSPTVNIEEKEGILSIPYQEEIQWYLNGQAINGATQQYLKRESGGVYSVIVYYKGCELKGTTHPLVTSLSHQLPIGVNVFPNPTVNELFVEIKNSVIQSVSLESMIGVTLNEVRLSDGEAHQRITFSVGDYPQGVYLLKITSGDKIYVKKIIKK